MIVISAFGGSGSSFLIRSLHKLKYYEFNFNPEKVSRVLHRLVDFFFKLTNIAFSKKKIQQIPLKILRLNKPDLIDLKRPSNYWSGSIYNSKAHFKKEFRSLINLPLKKLGKVFKIYRPSLVIIARPDSYGSEAMYDPNSNDYKNELKKLKSFIFKTIHYRSSGLKINYAKIDASSIESLVKSYIGEITKIEKKKKLQVVLISSSWGAHGIFKKLDIDNYISNMRPI